MYHTSIQYPSDARNDNRAAQRIRPCTIGHLATDSDRVSGVPALVSYIQRRGHRPSNNAETSVNGVMRLHTLMLETSSSRGLFRAKHATQTGWAANFNFGIFTPKVLCRSLARSEILNKVALACLRCTLFRKWTCAVHLSGEEWRKGLVPSSTRLCLRRQAATPPHTNAQMYHAHIVQDVASSTYSTCPSHPHDHLFQVGHRRNDQGAIRPWHESFCPTFSLYCRGMLN